MNTTALIFFIGLFLIGFLLLITELIILVGKKKREDDRKVIVQVHQESKGITK